MIDTRVLLVSSDPQIPDRFPREAEENGHPARFEPVAYVHEALERLANRSYGAVVCSVDSPLEVASVIRLRKARPDLPIVMLTSVSDAAFHSLGEQMGADLVLRKRSDLGRDAAGVLRALETRDLVRATRHFITRTKELTREVRELTRRTRGLVAEALGHAAASQPGEFATLIVEDTATDLLLCTRAMKKAGLPPFFRNVESAEAAVHYLSGDGEFASRDRFPFPKLIISDLNLPGGSGLELLRFVREVPEFRPTGFIFFTSSERSEDREEAMKLGANFFMVKSSNPEVLVDVVRSVFDRFVQERAGTPPG